MKQIITITLLLFCASFAIAQVPQAVCYQAVATDDSGQELNNQSIKVRCSFLKTSASGTPVWVEEHQVTSDAFGLFTLPLGLGTVTGGTLTNFSDVAWGTDKYFLKVEMDVNGGSNFVLMGTTQILSVPYALYSDRAAYADSTGFATNAATADVAVTAQSALDDADKDATNELQSLVYDNGNLTISPAPANGPATINIQDGDGDSSNELQTLAWDGNTGDISISGPTPSSINIRAGIFNAPGADFKFPQGVVGTYKFLPAATPPLSPNQYVVPTGKVFYVTALGSLGSGNAISFKLANSSTVKMIENAPNSTVFEAGMTIIDCNCTGIEVNTSTEVTPMMVDLATSYTVPVGKVLIIKSGLIGGTIIKLNNIPVKFYTDGDGSQSIIIPSGTIVASDGSVSPMVSGYLINMP